MSNLRDATPNSQSNNQNEILEQILLAVVAVQRMQQQILESLMNIQTN